jgi:hypothetical protein
MIGFVILLIFLCLLLLAALTVAVFYLWRFANIILLLENDFSDAVEVFQNAEENLESCLSQPMFFDSPQVQMATMEALIGVRASKVAIGKLVHKFTLRSKQKFVDVVEEKKEE